MENNRSKEKAARYALVYNKILQLIQEGLYPEGSKLPSEPSLAQQMQVSRSTLRPVSYTHLDVYKRQPVYSSFFTPKN